MRNGINRGDHMLAGTALLRGRDFCLRWVRPGSMGRTSSEKVGVMNPIMSETIGKTLRIDISVYGCCGDQHYKVKIYNRFTGEIHVRYDDHGDSDSSTLEKAILTAERMIEANPKL